MAFSIKNYFYTLFLSLSVANEFFVDLFSYFGNFLNFYEQIFLIENIFMHIIFYLI
jgi:hypothetical protein